MAAGNINGGWLAVAGALAGAWLWLRRTPSMSQAQALTIAQAYAQDAIVSLRSLDPNAQLGSFERAIYWVGQPPLLPWPWTYGNDPNWWVQFGLSYIDPLFGSKSNMIVVVNALSGGIVVPDLTNIDVFNYFQSGPVP